MMPPGAGERCLEQAPENRNPRHVYRHLSVLTPLILTMATHSRILPGEFHEHKRLARLQSMGSQGRT